MLIVMCIIFWTAAFILLYLGNLFPALGDSIIWDIVVVLAAIGPSIFLLYRIWVSRSWKQTDWLPKWQHLINYLRRDNEVIPITGERAYPGESFLDVEGLGLIEFLGKDCYYNWGDKKVIWGLENINFTPDPRYFNLTHLLWELGFTDNVDVANVLNGNDLELMGRVYLRMQDYDDNHGANRLVKDLKDYSGKAVSFKPKKSLREHDILADLVDKLTKKGDT